MPSAPALLPWALLVLAFVPGLALAAQNKGRVAFGHWPLIALAFLAALGLPPLASVIAETAVVPGVKVLDLGAFFLGALVITAGGLLHQWAEEDQSADAALVGIGAAVLLLLGTQEGALASLTVLSALLGMAAAALAWAYLGFRRAMLQALMAGGSLLLAAGLAGFWKEGEVRTVVAAAGLLVVGASILSLLRFKEKPLSPLISCLILLGGAGALAAASGGSLMGKGAILVGVAAAVAILLDFAVPSAGPRLVLGGLVWLAGSAYAFSLMAAFGVALFLMGGVGALLLLRRPDLLSTLAPLAAVALYRIVRESGEGAIRSFDIGHHYGLIGLLIGVYSVETVSNLLKGMKCDCFLPWAKGVAGAAFLFFLLIGAGLVLQDRGVVGLLVGSSVAAGLGFARTRGSSLASAALSLGAGTLLALSFKALLPFLNVGRDAKQVVLVAFAVGTLVSLAALVLLARPTTGEIKNEQSLA